MDGYMLRSQEIMLGVPQWARSRCQVVGDLFTDAVGTSPSSVSWALPDKLQSQAQDRNGVPIVGLLPGSKVVPFDSDKHSSNFVKYDYL